MIVSRNLDQYAELHRTKAYGRGNRKNERILAPWVFLKRPASILDYGAGQSLMVHNFVAPGAAIRHRYDPAIPEISKPPLRRYDLVVCTDVLEHLDEAEINPALEHIRALGDDALLAVDTRVANTILPSGENAHATVRPSEWWLDKVRPIFPDSEVIFAGNQRAVLRTWPASVTAERIAPALGFLIKLFRRA